MQQITRANSWESISRGTETVSARVTFEKPDLCYTPSGAQGSPMWMTCSHSRQRWGQGCRSRALLVSRDQRSTTKYGATTRSSPAPKHDCFRVLWGRDERGEGVGCYSSRLGLAPGMDTATLNRVFRDETRVLTACSTRLNKTGTG